MAAEKAQQNETTPQPHLPDPLALGNALIEAYSKAQPIWQDYLEKHGADMGDMPLDPLNVREAWTEYMERVAENPQKFWQDQMEFWNRWSEMAQDSALKFWGEQTEDKPTIEPEKGDRRFRAPEWQESAVFDFIKQSYLLTCDWMDKSVRDMDGIDEQTKEKLAFSSKLFANALSPTNFVLTNPEVINETLKTGGDNLVRGLENLIEDLKRGGGELKISTTDYTAFELGKNIATTKGSVIFENDLMQLIQYEPTTPQSYKRPLLVIPPWINKYYILDLREDNSFVKWNVDQGYTTFVISWVNPDTKLAKKEFEDYMSEGILAALDQIENITGEESCNAVGYCLGGTLLTTTLAYLKEHKQSERIHSATFLTTLVDFEHAGDMKLFMDDAQLDIMEKQMAQTGVLQAKQLQQTFSLLRANDLIWSFVVNNYLLGREPFPFDLLYWNDDSTNMPAAMHSFYLRNMYRDNKLIEPGGITIKDTAIDISKIDTPSYYLSTREDHIAPWKATYATTQYTSSKEKTFTLAASGHIAGVVNPPVKEKYCYWTNNKTPENAEDWLNKAEEHNGSWWSHWDNWLSKRSGEKITARTPQNTIEKAPGRYVKTKA